MSGPKLEGWWQEGEIENPEQSREKAGIGMGKAGGELDRDHVELCRPFKKFGKNPQNIQNALKSFQQGRVSDEGRTG